MKNIQNDSTELHCTKYYESVYFEKPRDVYKRQENKMESRSMEYMNN